MSKFANSFLKCLGEDTNGVTPTDSKNKKEFKGKKDFHEPKGLKKEDTHGASPTDDENKSEFKGKKDFEEPKGLGKKILVQGSKPLKEYLDLEAAGEAPAPHTPPPAHDKQAAEPSDEDAWKGSLDKNTNPDDFKTADNPQMHVDNSGVDAARDWIKKLEEMAEFVNGTGPESLNSKINDLEVKNSVPFRGVVRREEKRITKLAENLRGLAEVFKTVVTSSHKKIKDSTSPR